MVNRKVYLFLLTIALAAFACIAAYLGFLLPRVDETATAVENYTVVEPGGYYDSTKFLVIDDDGNWTGVKLTDGDGRSWPESDVHLILPTNVKRIASASDPVNAIKVRRNIRKISFADETKSLFTEVAASTNGSSLFSVGLNSIIFPSNGKHQTIGAYSFYNTCTDINSADGLQHIEFRTKNGVTIGERAFALCYGLRSVDSYTGSDTSAAAADKSSIGNYAFSEDNQLYRAVFPSNLTSIGAYAFSHSGGQRSPAMLSDFVIGDKVSSIGARAFYGMGLVRFTIPSALAPGKVGDNCFEGCTRIAEIENHSSSWTLDQIKNQFSSAMNIYGVNTGNSTSQLIRSFDGLIFCKNTLGKSDRLNARVNYQTDRWYLVGYSDIYEHWYKKNALLLKLPDGIGSDTPRWKVKFSGEYYTDTAFPGVEYDYLDVNGEPVKNNSVSVTEYDIGKNAFNSLWMPYIEISDAVVNIGDSAFHYSHVSSVVLGENVKTIGSTTFHCIGSSMESGPNSLTVFMPSNTDIQYGTNAFNVSSGFPARFIYKNKNDYDSNAGKRPTTNASNCTYTYFMYVNYRVADNGKLLNDWIQHKKVHGFGYNSSFDDFNVFTPSSSASGALPSINDFMGVGNLYSSTVWYTASGENKFATKRTFTDVNNLLTANNDLSQIDLYANKVDVPVLKNIERPYDGTTHTIKEITGLAEATEGAPYDVTMTFENHEGTASEKQGINDAGVYTISVALNPAWGVWSGNTTQTMTVTVTKAEINLRDPGSLSWEASDGSGVPVSMQTGNLYIKDAFNVSLQEISGVTPRRVVESYVRYRDNREISVELRTDSRFDISYTVDSSGSTVGEYRTTATLTPDANYKFVTTGELDGAYGVSVSVNASGVATVNKMWYIVTVGNWVVEDGDADPDDNTPEFVLADHNGWTYGDDSVVFSHPPVLRYGSRTEITFTLLRNGSVVGDADGLKVWNDENGTKSNFEDYFNSSMPAGEYTLTINVPSLTVDDATYPAIERVYRFTVSPRAFTDAERETVTAALRGNTFEYLYDGRVHLWEGGNAALVDGNSAVRTDTFAALESLLGKRDDGTQWQTERKGVWADSAYDELYGNARLTYNLYRMQNNDYVTESYFDNTGNTLLKDVNVYKVYYQFTASSYSPMVNVTTDERRDSSFSVVIYRLLDIPDYDAELGYTGMRRTPYLSSNENYAVEWTETGEDAYVHARREVNGKKETIRHRIILRSYDGNLYRWNTADIAAGGNVYIDPDDPAKLVLTFTITPAINRWSTAPRIIEWNWGSFNASINRIVATPYYGATDVTFAIYPYTGDADNYVYGNAVEFVNDAGDTVAEFSLTSDGELPDWVVDVLTDLDAGGYELRASVPESADYTGLAGNDRPFKFDVLRAHNVWENAPAVSGWIFGSFTNEMFAGGSTTYGDLLYTVSDANGNSMTDYTALTYQAMLGKIGDLPVGDYTLTVYTADSENADYMPVSANFRFTVAPFSNKWIDIPVIEGWSTEYEPNDPTGSVMYGEIVYTYRTVDGTPLKGKPTEEGTYVLCATVELEGYETLYAEYEFTVTPAFDTTFLIANLILAFVVCVFAVIDIVFAIRRNKEC